MPKTETRELPYGLRATFTIDEEKPREVAPERPIEKYPHHEKCRCGKCPNKQKAA
jgi:hypothetical protein